MNDTVHTPPPRPEPPFRAHINREAALDAVEEALSRLPGSRETFEMVAVVSWLRYEHARLEKENKALRASALTPSPE